MSLAIGYRANRRIAMSLAVTAGLLSSSLNCVIAAPAAPSSTAGSTGAQTAAGKAIAPKTAPTMPPVAPPIAKPPGTSLPTAPTAESPRTALPANGAATPQQLREVAELESLMFGQPRPNIPMEYRIDRLESVTFHTTNPDWDLTRRIQRLTQTLIGDGTAQPPAATQHPPVPQYPDPGNAYQDPPAYPQQLPYNQQTGNYPGQDYGQNYQQDPQPKRTVGMPPTPDLDSPEYQRALPQAQAEQYALDIVNQIRNFNGASSLTWDEVAHKVATDHVRDLCGRNTVSHHNASGENPDVRYTKAGGTDAMLESVISLKTSGRVSLNKAIVYKIIQELTNSQDDRDALMSAHATQFAFSFGNSEKSDKLIACTEVVTDQAELQPIPTEVQVGEKIEIKGVIKAPYRFQKITVAWEGLNPNVGEVSDEEQDEALPYFPPLDFTAYAKRAEHDWERAARWLQIGGMGLAIAGGLFVPPVALAAPLIASASPPIRPKPVSDIPVKGGVKVAGPAFEHKAVISKDNKEGIYYITVWVQTDADPTPIPISRRAIIAKAADIANGNQQKSKSRELITAVGKNKPSNDAEKDTNEIK